MALIEKTYNIKEQTCGWGALIEKTYYMFFLLMPHFNP
jgi:hypothetical protein